MPRNRKKALFQLLFILHHLPLSSTAGCVPAYFKYPSKSSSGFFDQFAMKTYDECGTLCSGMPNCKGYGYNSATSTCYLGANDDPVDATSVWSFSLKMCLEDLLALLPTTEEITTTELVTTIPTTIQLSTIATFEDTTTFPITTAYTSTTQQTTKQTTIQTTEQTTEHTTQQSTEQSTERTTEHTTIQTTEQTTGQTTQQTTEQITEQTTQKTTKQTTEQTTALETTQDMQTTSTSTTTSSDFLSSYCICICLDSNMTVSERIEKRKQNLQLSVRELSAFRRKLTCAPDFRPSSTSVGSVGVIILVMFGILFTFPDITRVMHAFRRYVKRKKL